MCGFARMGPTSLSCSFKRKQAEHILILNTYKSQEKSMSWAVNLMVFLDLRKREFFTQPKCDFADASKNK